MRKAFTLVEVLVAAGIISIVGLALLQSHSTNTKLINRMSTQYHIKEEFSLVLLNANVNYSGSTKTIYDFVSQKFSIDNDDIRKWLKSRRLSYKDKEFSTIKLTDADMEEITSQVEGLDDSNLPDLVFVINRVKSNTKDGSAQGFKVKLQ